MTLLLAVAVTACGGVATPPSPGMTPMPTQLPTATVEPFPTAGPQAIPGGVQTVTLASEGESIVAGEVEPTTGLAYFLDSAGWLYVFDGASLEVVAQAQVLPSVGEGSFYDLAVDSEGGRVYVADGAREEIIVLDAATLSPVGRIEAFGRITADAVTHRLYIAQVGVYVADGETGEIVGRMEETIPEEGMEMYSGVPRGVDVYVNPSNRHLYVMMYNNTPGSNARWWLDLYDVDDHTLLAERVPSPDGSSDAPGFDLQRGVDYVAGGHPIADNRQLVGINAEGREVGHLWGVRGQAFFSPRHHLVYTVARWDQLDVVDAETMNYLDSYPLTVTLHDPRNGRFYSVDWSGGTVTILDEPTVSLAPKAATSEWRGRLPSADLGDIDSLVLSPTFSDDDTLFVAVRTSLFASGDGGDSWRELILPFAVRGTIRPALSPNFAHDWTLLLGLDCTPAGNGVLRSTDGGLHWSRANSGLTDLGIGALIFSPDYAQDGTIFARGCFDGVFKSTDGGVTWRWLTAELMAEEGQERVTQLLISPAYARDRTLWALTSAHAYRSQDAGESWQRLDIGSEGVELKRLVLSPTYGVDGVAFVTAGPAIYITRNEGEDWALMELPTPGLWVTELVLSPDFASDGVLFVAGLDEEYRDHLYRSTDHGEAWAEVGNEFAGESVSALALSHEYAADGLVLAATDGSLYRSTDGGAAWQPLNIPGAWAPFFVFSPDFASDQTVYVALGQALYRSQDGGESWTALHEAAAAPPTPLPTPVAPPAPSPSPTPLACPGLDPAFRPIADWLETLRPNVTDVPSVGCPRETARTVSGAWQVFLMWAPGSTMYNLPGYMIWRSDSRIIYVIPQGDRLTGRTEALTYDDTWSEGMPEIPPACAGLTPPTGLQIPIRGFGKIWCDAGLYQRIGFAYGGEQDGDLLLQETPRGLYLRLPDGPSFAIDVIEGLALSR